MGGLITWRISFPGLIMMSVITNSYANVSSSFFGAKFGRFVEEMLVSPISNQTILFGYVTGGVARCVGGDYCDNFIVVFYASSDP